MGLSRLDFRLFIFEFYISFHSFRRPARCRRWRLKTLSLFYHHPDLMYRENSLFFLFQNYLFACRHPPLIVLRNMVFYLLLTILTRTGWNNSARINGRSLLKMHRMIFRGFNHEVQEGHEEQKKSISQKAVGNSNIEKQFLVRAEGSLYSRRG